MFKSTILVVTLSILMACFLACGGSDDPVTIVESDFKLQPLDRLAGYYARTDQPKPARPVNLGDLHNRGLDRCFKKHQATGGVFMNRDLFCRIVSESANEVFAEDDLDVGSTCTPVDMRVLFCLYDDLRERGVFNIYIRNPDYFSMLSHMLDQGYLDPGEHSELAYMFERLMAQGGRRASLYTASDARPQPDIGKIAAEVMEASLQYWHGQAAGRAGTVKNGDKAHQTDDRFFDSTMKAAGDVLGILIASATGAGVVAGGLASIGASYLMELAVTCVDEPPGVYGSCNNNVQDPDYWLSWPGPFWY